MKKIWILPLLLIMTASISFAQEFSKTGFSSAKCAGGLPVKKSKNPWLKIQKQGSGEAYHVTPTDKSKTFSILNVEDPIYNAPTNLERIDCKNGLIYFRRSVSEPVTTTTHRVYDLITGSEYIVTEGAVAMAPDGIHLMTVSSTDRDQKCGRSANCETSFKIFECRERKSKKFPCETLKSAVYTFTGSEDHNVEFATLPMKWIWNKPKKNLTLSLGGFKKSQAKIQCTILPKYKCNVEVPKYYQVSIKN